MRLVFFFEKVFNISCDWITQKCGDLSCKFTEQCRNMKIITWINYSLIENSKTSIKTLFCYFLWMTWFCNRCSKRQIPNKNYITIIIYNWKFPLYNINLYENYIVNNNLLFSVVFSILFNSWMTKNIFFSIRDSY